MRFALFFLVVLWVGVLVVVLLQVVDGLGAVGVGVGGSAAVDRELVADGVLEKKRENTLIGSTMS